MKPTVDLDHIAIATTDIGAALQTAVGNLGGVVFHGGDGYGFRWVQTRLGTGTTGMTIELLVVWQPEVNDFLARFVDRHGPGVHHMTFKVRDLHATLERCTAMGLDPVGVNLDNPGWREAFLQPKQAHGTVIQLAQTSDDWNLADIIDVAEREETPTGTPMWWPTAPVRGPDPTTLQRGVLGSPDRQDAIKFFVDLLDGECNRNDDTATDLIWPGGGELRIIDHDHAEFIRLEGTRSVPAAATFDLSGAPVAINPL